MPIPTEIVGSLPRPMKLQEGYQRLDDGEITWEELQELQNEAAEDSIKRLEQTGEPLVTDGEQRESSFATYPITDTLAGTGLAENLAGDGQYFAIFDDGHHRQLPRLTGGPFRYKTKEKVYRLCGENRRDDANGVSQKCSIGVINPLRPEVETPEQVRDELVKAAEHIGAENLGATDDCGFSPFSRDVKPNHESPDHAREVAMQKITNRLGGVRQASEELGI